jgi:hypothetical protein
VCNPSWVGSCPLQYTIDIKNTVWVLTCGCPDGMVLWHPYYQDMRELTPGQCSWYPYYYILFLLCNFSLNPSRFPDE